MKKIKETKISLMQKEGNALDGNKHKYIVKCSATLDTEKAFEHVIDMGYEDFVLESSNAMYEELSERNKNIKMDSLGVWFEFDDSTKIDNSIDLSVLNDIKKYGANGIEPVKEFIKMTLGLYESKND